MPSSNAKDLRSNVKHVQHWLLVSSLPMPASFAEEDGRVQNFNVGNSSFKKDAEGYISQ